MVMTYPCSVYLSSEFFYSPLGRTLVSLPIVTVNGSLRTLIGKKVQVLRSLSVHCN